jgi:hypothetical protein
MSKPYEPFVLYCKEFFSKKIEDFTTREIRLRREGRTKILPISEEWVLTDFVNRVMGQPSPNYSSVLADNKQVPPDVVIGRVQHNVFNRQFDFQVFHETFEPVREGQNIPRLYPMYAMQKVIQPSGKVSTDFTQAADIEANTPITVGGSSDRFSLRMVGFGELKMGDECYYVCKSKDGEKNLKTLRKRNKFHLVPYKEYSRPSVSGALFSSVDNETMVFVKADNPDDHTMPLYYDHGQLKSRYDETGNNIVTKFSGECGVLTREKIENTTQSVTDRGIATFFSPSGPMADDVSESVDRCKQELAKHHQQAVKVMSDLFNEEVQEPAVVEEKKVKFREWL